jgi:hypothetical protein
MPYSSSNLPSLGISLGTPLLGHPVGVVTNLIRNSVGQFF